MAETVPKVVVVGGVYVDMAVKCEQIPSASQAVVGSALSYMIAGPGANQAGEAALCGCGVQLISRIGGGPFGKMVLSGLEEFGVDTDFVRIADAKNTGVIVTVVNSTGENTSITYTGANAALSPAHIDEAEHIISDADVCLIDGNLPVDAVVRAVSCAKLHGTKVVLNPARPSDTAAATVAAMPVEYFNADILILNLFEAADITERLAANIHTAKLIGSDLVARGAAAAVITMGRRGCIVADRSSCDHIPAFEIKLVDKSCSGDAFTGALAAYTAVEDDVRGAVKFAAAAGALACTKFGSIESLPTRAEIIELLQKNDTE